jgi:hypothetical protein
MLFHFMPPQARM